MTATLCSSGIMENDMSFYKHQPESVELISLNQSWSQPCHLLLQITSWILLSFPNMFVYLKRKNHLQTEDFSYKFFTLMRKLYNRRSVTSAQKVL